MKLGNIALLNEYFPRTSAKATYRDDSYPFVACQFSVSDSENWS